MSIEDAIAEAHNHGLMINNLFELEDGNWQANVKSRGKGFENGVYHNYAKAEGPEEALLGAIQKSFDDPKFSEGKRKTSDAKANEKIPGLSDIEDLL